jgi:hypothetical protein
MIAATTSATNADGIYQVASFDRTYGNHRAKVNVNEASPAVVVTIDWARRDVDPDKKDIVVTDAKGKPIANRVVLTNTNDQGKIVFEPKNGPGSYYVYFLPYTTSGWMYFPKVTYNTPQITADLAWKSAYEAKGIDNLPVARVEALQSRSAFDRFTMMDERMRSEDEERLRANSKGLVAFILDAGHPITQTDHLPQVFKDGLPKTLKIASPKGQFVAYQIGMWAAQQDLNGVQVKFNNLISEDSAISAKAMRCINLGGTDWLGHKFTKAVSVPKGKVQVIWCGIDLDTKQKPGLYRGVVEVTANDKSKTKLNIELTIENRISKDRGENDLSSMARLKWLDSTIGLDDEVVAPFTPLKVKGNEISCIQRTVTFSELGLPSRIVSKGHDVLASPIQFIVQRNGQETTWKPKRSKTIKKAPATYEKAVESVSDDLSMTCRYRMEADGYINYWVTVKAHKETAIDDIRLEIPYTRESSTYSMGMGMKGGYRPKDYKWNWDLARANNLFWLGGVESGMQCKLKVASDSWDIYNLTATGLPKSWHNEGQGGCHIFEQGNAVVAQAYSGTRTLKAGEEVEYRFALLITPVKPLDPEHWNQRYYHISDWQGKDPQEMVDLAKKNGATVINIHQGNMLNPYINYPFVTAEKMAPYTAAAHKAGMKMKIYYTVRELSNYVAEMYALRSLNHEVFVDGLGGDGDSWLQEHLGSGYVPAWHTPLADGSVDAAIATVGLSRWHNYYLEGLRWLVENIGLDGLYLDGIGYDREIMKRVRKVLDRAHPGCLLDFHSGNNYDPAYGLNNCASGYMEHFPYINSLWFGEGFNYNESPDYWLVEVSGLPFGLYGEMLQDNGNPWRGMIYGMTARYYSGADPKHIWKLWDSFGIAKAKMLGYWSADCPVRTSSPDVLATAYVLPGKTLISVASWAKASTSVALKIDWKALGLDPVKARLVAPGVEGFQPAASFGPSDSIPVEPGKGWMLVVGQ